MTQAPGPSEPSRDPPVESANAHPDDDASAQESGSDREAEDSRQGAFEGGAGGASGSGKYRPPKLVPMPFDDDTSAGIKIYCNL